MSDVAGGPEQSGPELARAAVEAALAKHKAKPRRKFAVDAQGRRRGGYTGPGPDPRDPQPFGAVLERLVKQRGWQRPTADSREARPPAVCYRESAWLLPWSSRALIALGLLPRVPV